jgi:hypothetical protein
VAEDQPGQQVYSKVRTGGRRAVVPLNRTDTAVTITVRVADLGLSGRVSVRDVWRATGLGAKTSSFTVTVPAHDSVLLTIAPARAKCSR